MKIEQPMENSSPWTAFLLDPESTVKTLSIADMLVIMEDPNVPSFAYKCFAWEIMRRKGSDASMRLFE